MNKTTFLIITVMAVFLLTGCQKSPNKISGIQDLMLSEQDLQQLGLANDLNPKDLEQLGLINGTNCQTDEYSNIVDSSIGQHSLCVYTISSLNNTRLIIELQKFADYEALNGTYQYDSLHLFSIQGLISENNFGDQSRFRVNNVNDYGGQYNPPGIYFYHLWFTKNLYLVHITSSGSKDAEGYITRIGQLILSKF